MDEVKRTALPHGFGYEWAELALQESLAGNTAPIAFDLAVVFVSLVLAAMYESWLLPLAVVLIAPMSVLAALLGVRHVGLYDNVLVQVGLVVLVGLAAKNAILIVEFARGAERDGATRWEAAAAAHPVAADSDDQPRPVLGVLPAAAFGTLVEAASWRGLDDLSVPVGLHLVLAAYWETPLLQFLGLAAAFVAGLAVTMALAPALGLTRHAPRSYAVLVFLVCATTAPHNAVLPVLAVCAHLAARRLRPCRSPYPDLDLVATVAGVALLWLFLGE